MSKTIDMFAEQVFKEFDAGKSPYEIAEQFKTYPNKIRRLLLRSGRKLRDKAEAQQQALKSGRAKHPTEGTSRSDSVKDKISERLSVVCQDPKQIARRRESGKKRWESMSEAEKAIFLSKAAQGIRKASTEGSKLEKFVRGSLLQAGYIVEYHKVDLVPNHKLHIDIYLPTLRTCIEVDGPAHFFPIWGEESLQRHIKADSEKNGLLTTQGFNIIRVKQKRLDLSRKSQNDIVQEILKHLQRIESVGQLPLEERTIEIDLC
jgi:very-short-patch-repair endonuclease